LPESGFFVGSVVSSPSLDFEPICAPPVLTTTPGGAWVVVDPVDVDDVGSVDDGCVGSVAVGFSAGSAEADASVDVDVSVDDDSVDDGSEDGVSAHATGNPYPVTTATPTPRATANPLPDRRRQQRAWTLHTPVVAEVGRISRKCAN
jgi:hypothetical protein